LPTSVNVKGSKGQAGLTNLGWWGIDVKPQQYTGSFYVKGAYNGSFTASLQSARTGKVFASAKIASHSVEDKWVQHRFTLVPHSAAPDTNNTFSIRFIYRKLKTVHWTSTSSACSRLPGTTARTDFGEI
jgi:alpha-N-arabinofuranosidase